MQQLFILKIVPVKISSQSILSLEKCPQNSRNFPIQFFIGQFLLETILSSIILPGTITLLDNSIHRKFSQGFLLRKIYLGTILPLNNPYNVNLFRSQNKVFRGKFSPDNNYLSEQFFQCQFLEKCPQHLSYAQNSGNAGQFLE